MELMGGWDDTHALRHNKIVTEQMNFIPITPVGGSYRSNFLPPVCDLSSGIHVSIVLGAKVDGFS